jgi:tRNA(Ile)-lysidine synthase TilS/MesJ
MAQANQTSPFTCTLSLSGGVDSMTHLCLLHALRQKIPCAFVACHIRHSSRPEEAEKEEAWVAWVCGRLNVPVFSHAVEVSRPHHSAPDTQHRVQGSATDSVSRSEFEELARNVRFDMYTKAHKIAFPSTVDASEASANVVAMIGHHMDDLDENRLAELGKKSAFDVDGMGVLEFIHNTTASGTSQIAASVTETGLILWRPLLLNTRKSEILAAASELGLPYMHDSTPEWSRRGWIRAVVDALPEKPRLLELLEAAAQLSRTLTSEVHAGIAQWRQDGGLGQVHGVLRSVELDMFVLNVADLFKLVDKVQDKFNKFRVVVDELADLWNPAVKKFCKEERPDVPCPIQEIRNFTGSEEMKPLLLIEALIRCFKDIKPAITAQLPNRVTARQLCETTFLSDRPAVAAQLHKNAPVVWVKGRLCLVRNLPDLVRAFGGKAESAALAVKRLLIET